MADPTLDESIHNLDVFCMLLTETSVALAADAASLDSLRADSQRSPEEARARAEALADRLEAATHEIGDTGESTVDALEALAGDARELVRDHLGAAGERLGQMEEGFRAHVEEQRVSLERDRFSLSDSGFGGLDGALEAAAATLSQAGVEAEQAIETLGELVAGTAGELLADDERTLRHLETLSEGLHNDQRSLEDGAAELTRGCDDLAAAINHAADATGAPLQGGYDAWLAELVAESEELMDAVAAMIQQAAGHLLDDTAEPLEQAVDGATRGALAPLALELERLAPLALDGEQAAAEAASLVDDLVVARRVVGEIDELLDAMKE